MRSALGKLLKSNFETGNDSPSISFNVFAGFSNAVLLTLMKTSELLLFLALDLDLTESSQGRNLQLKPNGKHIRERPFMETYSETHSQKHILISEFLD